MKFPARLVSGARIPGVLLVALTVSGAAAESLKVLSAIPRDAVSPRQAFVLAAGGESFFFNPSRGIHKAPFLPGVYKPLGFSPDGRGFLYLKSQGRLPGFSLYLHDLVEGAERLITAERVFHAAFSPDGSRIAYLTFDTLDETALFVQPVAFGPAQRLDTGRLALDFVAWSEDGGRLAWRRLTPIGENFAEEGTYHHTLVEHDLATGVSDRHEGALWGRFENGRLVYWKDGALLAGGKRDGRLASVSAGDGVEGFLPSRGGSFVTRVAGGAPRVEKLDPQGRGREIARGSILLDIDDGLVVREFTGSGVRYSFVDFGAEAASELFAFTGVYRMPMAGTATLNQGGALYTAGTCDGANCRITSHRNMLGFALDFQQQRGLGQGDENVLAAEDGVVVTTVNTVNCNTTSSTCVDYRPGTCMSNGGAGNTVILAHPDGTFTSYSHLAFNSVVVQANQAVCRGTKLAVQGHSGSTAPGGYMNCDNHLHFQRIRNLVGSDPFSQSIATDFDDLPCALACGAAYSSRNEQTPASCVSLPPTVIATNPPGLSVLVDGEPVVTPRTYGWPAGEAHTITPISPQGSGDSRRVFTGWSDGGPATRIISGHGTNTIATYTANFQAQFLLETTVLPPGSGSVTTRPPSADNYFAQGARITLVPVPGPGFQFTAWTGDVTTAQPEPALTMSAKRSVTAHFVPAPAVNTGGIVNAADFGPVLVRGAIFSIFGLNLAPATIVVGEIPLPVRVADVIVEIREPGRIQSAPLYFISPGQINAQMPPDVTSPLVDIIVRTPAGITTVTNIPVSAAAPRLFTYETDRGRPIVVRANYTLIDADSPALGGEGAFVYVNGLGAVSPAKGKGEPGGDGGALGPLNRVVETVRLFVGGEEVEAAFAGLAPGLVGVYQVNFVFPTGLAAGNRSILVRVGDQASQAGLTVPYVPAP
jgi:uncharacterized protein (TIGR03437 family)